MSPSELKKLTVKQLRAIRTASFTLSWTLALEKETPAVQTQTALHLLDVQRAIVKLENAQLASLRDALVENEKALAQGAADCEKALGNLKNAKKVIDGVAAFVSLAVRIAKLAA